MNKDQKGDLVEKLIFEAYKDKRLGGARVFKGKIKSEYGYDVSSELYVKICNYQIEKYGTVIFEYTDPYDKWRKSKTRKIRITAKDNDKKNKETKRLIERAEKREIKRIKQNA